MTEDLTTKILIEIRDGIGRTNDRLDTTVDRLDSTINRLEKLERRQTEMEVRLSTELIAVVQAVNTLKDVIIEDRKLRSQVDDHESRLRAVERKLG